jgi:asparagine synthase (glutamine-hydrolysing)
VICAALGVSGLVESEARSFTQALGAMPGSKLQQFAKGNLVFGQLAHGATWQPGRSASGRLALVNGQIHNRRALAAELGGDPDDPAGLYAAALDRWGNAADEHVIGHYCAIAVEPGGTALRCARSPIEAPPLLFRQHRGGAIAASLARPLFWRDPAPRQVNLDRLGRSLLVDFSERYAGHFLDCQRIPQGAAIVLDGAGWREVWRYDLFSRPEVRFRRPQDYVDTGLALLDEAVERSIDGARNPGILLSGGLDSGSVAASALRQAAPGTRVHGFVHGPPADWQAVKPYPGTYSSEFAAVSAFAEMHPGLAVEEFRNPGLDFRHRQRELLQAMDCGTPSVGLCWAHHAIHERAAALGCEVLLSPNWGNETFSNNAPWAFPEWLARGRWGRLAAALRRRHADPRPLWRKTLGLAVLPWLPTPLWRQIQRVVHGSLPDPLAGSGLNPAWVRDKRMLEEIRARGFEPRRIQFRSKREFWTWIMAEDGQDREAYSQGMEVLYGVPLRDPAAYRPLVEFCFGLPTEVFQRGPEDRWLAREMARGRMPEAQRLCRDFGAHNPDWHARQLPAAAEVTEELERMASDPDISALIDLPRMQALVKALPELDPGDHAARIPYLTALPIAIAAGRFIALTKGRNDV